MLYSTLFSILFFSVCIVSLVSGIFVLQNNHKTLTNRCYFALTVTISIWSAGFALATSAVDMATCEAWRRFSALGWGTAYSIVLHFILIITGRKALLKKWWSYLFLYLPAVITVLTFAIPSGINPVPYQLQPTEFGWVNVAEHNVWDLFFYAYYLSFMTTTLILVWRWGKDSSDLKVKSQARIIFLSFMSAVVLATITDVLLSSTHAKLPQMAPIVTLIPIMALYYTIKKYGFIISEGTDNRTSYTNIVVCVILYSILIFSLRNVSIATNMTTFLSLEVSSFRGILTQLQMLISLYLVLKENKPGLITAVLLNTISIFGSTVFMINNKTTASLPGIISYLGVLMIMALITNYKRKVANNIEEIYNQRRILEKSKENLYHMAYYDSLTGLPNKDLFVERLEQAIHLAKGNDSFIGVALIDLDSFKSVNDTLGHTIGDMVLRQMANRLSSCLREEDTIARFGGDEFLIMIDSIHKTKDINEISNKIMGVFKTPIIIQDVEFFISASAGVAVFPVDGENSETLIKNADIAMYSAKSKGKNQCVYSSSGMKNDVTKMVKLTNSLYRALDKNELFLHYQPQVKAETQEIIGFEALLRWNNDEYGTVTPDVFIPIAEQTGLIRSIGLWIVEQACLQHKRFREIYDKDFLISINLSLVQLKDPKITDKITRILNNTQTDAKNIQIEITESTTFYEEPFVLQRLKDIKDLGISIAIDDFGTGYSSFSRLRTFPIDLIKIDMDFVRGISSKSKKDRAIIKSIIQIAKNLEIEVLAEGVETEKQFRYLKNKACDKIQGYYFYRPMSANEIESILKLL